jgi:hypothetical protein
MTPRARRYQPAPQGRQLSARERSARRLLAERLAAVKHCSIEAAERLLTRAANNDTTACREVLNLVRKARPRN